MENQSENLPPKDLFFKMEKDYNLFSLRTDEKFPIWDIIRYKVFHELIYSSKSIKSNQTSPSSKKVLFIFPKLLLSILKIFIPFNENLFFLTSRNIDSQGFYFDKNADNALESFRKNEITIIESCTPIASYKYFGNYYILNTALRVLKKLLEEQKLNDIVKTNILNSLDQFYSGHKITGMWIEEEYNRFYKDYRFYSWLFKRNKNSIKRLFVTQNGIQKGLFLAAKSAGIKSFEFQHGIIDQTHMAYSYNSQIDYKKGDIIHPDVMLTFSDYWPKLFFHPFINFIACGNDYFSTKEIHDSKDALLVISSIIHDYELRVMVNELAKSGFNKKICYKLHPNQFNQYDEIVNHFKAFKNIQVIKNELSVPELIARSEALLTIASTAVYEALHAGCKVIILKRLNYLAHEDLFNMNGVFLADTQKELSYAYNQKSKPDSQEVFFHPFIKNKLLSSLSI